MVKKLLAYSLCIIIIAFAGSSFFSSKGAHAHGIGQSLEKTVGEYFIDVGYNTLTIEEDQSVRFDFDLMLNETREGVLFTDIWVRIMQGRQLVFAGSIKKADFGKTGISFTFPKSGEYELTTRFQKDGETLVEAPFSLTVERETVLTTEDARTSRFSPETLVAALIGLILGFSMAFIFLRGRKTQSTN